MLIVMLNQAPTVLTVEAVKPSHGMIQTGSSVVVKFSHDTNTPVVTRSNDRKRLMSMSPPELEQLPHMAYWQDKRTLVILFMAVGKEDKVHTADIAVKFLEADGTRNCVFSSVISDVVCVGSIPDRSGLVLSPHMSRQRTVLQHRWILSSHES